VGGSETDDKYFGGIKARMSFFFFGGTKGGHVLRVG